MLQINIYPEKKVSLFYKDAKYLVNELELSDALCQICENDLTGVYIKWNKKKITINSNGELSNWPEGMFDTTQKLYARLVRARKNKTQHMNHYENYCDDDDDDDVLKQEANNAFYAGANADEIHEHLINVRKDLK